MGTVFPTPRAILNFVELVATVTRSDPLEGRSMAELIDLKNKVIAAHNDAVLGPAPVRPPPWIPQTTYFRHIWITAVKVAAFFPNLLDPYKFLELVLGHVWVDWHGVHFAWQEPPPSVSAMRLRQYVLQMYAYFFPYKRKGSLPLMATSPAFDPTPIPPPDADNIDESVLRSIQYQQDAIYGNLANKIEFRKKVEAEKETTRAAYDVFRQLGSELLRVPSDVDRALYAEYTKWVQKFDPGFPEHPKYAHNAHEFQQWLQARAADPATTEMLKQQERDTWRKAILGGLAAAATAGTLGLAAGALVTAGGGAVAAEVAEEYEMAQLLKATSGLD